MPYPQDDQPSSSSPDEEFKLLDIQGSTGSPAYRSTANAIGAAGGNDVPLQDKLSRLAFTGVNIVFSCSAIAVAKQLFNPASYGASTAGGAAGGASAAADAAKEAASKALPAWFQSQYNQRRVGQEMTQRVLRDTGVLMAASGMWYGLQWVLRTLRGEHDAFNVCVAGTVSAGWLGATFIEPFKLTRAGTWGAVGGLLGYYGYREQQALRAALLEKQQELEQKHMRVGPDQVRQTLDPKLLQELLQREQKERKEAFRAELQKQGVQPPASNGDAGSGALGDGVAAGAGGGDDQWQRLLSSAPWLVEDESDGSDDSRRS